MSVSIPNWMVQQFSAIVHQLSEQKMSVLLPCVMEEGDFGSEAKAVDRIGSSQDAPDLVTTRHGATPIGNTPHTRRWIYPSDYDVPADLIDRQDKVKLLIDPQSIYAIKHSSTMARGMDDAIVAALGGSVSQGHYGPNGQATSVALPSAQKIAHGSTGLTLAKLIEIGERFDEDSVDPMWERYFVGTPKQRSDLLNDDKITGADYNTVKALVMGQVDSFVGLKFKWLPSARLPVLTAGGTDRGCYAFARPAIRFGFTMRPSTSVDKRPDMRNAMQVYTTGSWGAARLEDEMVIQVACDEA